MSDLMPLVNKLVDIRKEAEFSKSIIDKRKKEWEKENEALIQRYAELKNTRDQYENDLRWAAMQEFKEKGDKQICPGVGIREIMTYKYDEQAALKWAIQSHMAVLLDKKAFEKICSVTDFAFVEKKKEVRATISPNLKHIE